MSEWFPTFRSIGDGIWHTPIRDMLRLHFSGRLNWRAKVAASDLPEIAKQKITDVVKATRLWRLEKAQIANELIAHFHDGQQRGQTVEELVSEFGETQTVAQLMRSAKKRNRSLLWKTFVLGCYSLVAFLVFYAGLAVWFFSGKPNPSVDYLYALNATARAVPVEERAWPIYRNAWIEHDFYDLSTHQSMEPLLMKVSNDGRQQTLSGPRDKEWQQVIRFLEEHKTLVDAFRVGGQRAGFGLELAYKSDYSEEDFKALYGLRSWQAKDERRRNSNDSATNFDKSLINIQPPRLQMMQGVAAVLRADTLRAAEEGQAELVVEDITAMLGLGTQVAEYPTLLFALLGFAVERGAFDSIEELIAVYPQLLNRRQIKKIFQRVESLQIRSFVSQEGEQLLRKDIIQHIYSDDGNGNGRITHKGMVAIPELSGLAGSVSDHHITTLSRLVGPAAMFASSSRKKVEQVLDELVDRINSDFAQPIFKKPLGGTSTKEATLKECNVTDIVTVNLLKVFLTDIDWMRVAVEHCDARRGAVLIALAAKLYELDHGRWPGSIDELVPTFLKEVPPDPVTGEPVNYAVINGAPVIYSVGFDRDDDGGRAAADSLINGQVWPKWIADPVGAPDGDWILWPVNEETSRP